MTTDWTETIANMTDEYIDKNGVVVPYPGTPVQKLSAIIAHADRLETDLVTEERLCKNNGMAAMIAQNRMIEVQTKYEAALKRITELETEVKRLRPRWEGIPK